MAEVTENDIVRYLRGEIDDPDERQRIERACVEDPLVGLAHDDLLEHFAPPSPATTRRRAAFARHDRAVFGRIVFEVAAGQTTGEFQGSISLSQASSPEVPFAVIGRADAGRLRLDFSAVPSGWEPDSIGMFTPHGADPLTLERGQRPAGTIIPLSRDPLRLAAATGDAKQPGDPVLLGCSGGTAEEPQWRVGPASNASGAEISVVAGRADAAYLKYRFPVELAPLGKAKFHALCVDATEQRVEREIRLGRARDGFYESDVSLGMTTRQIRRASFFEVDVAPCGPADVNSLSAREFRDVMTRDYQMLILRAAKGGQPHAFEAAFESDDERRLWTNPDACHFIRFLPAVASQQ